MDNVELIKKISTDLFCAIQKGTDISDKSDIKELLQTMVSIDTAGLDASECLSALAGGFYDGICQPIKGL